MAEAGASCSRLAWFFQKKCHPSSHTDFSRPPNLGGPAGVVPFLALSWGLGSPERTGPGSFPDSVKMHPSGFGHSSGGGSCHRPGDGEPGAQTTTDGQNQSDHSIWPELLRTHTLTGPWVQRGAEAGRGEGPAQGRWLRPLPAVATAPAAPSRRSPLLTHTVPWFGPA